MARWRRWGFVPLASVALLLFSQNMPGSAQVARGGRDEPIESLELRPQFHLVAGAGGNIGVLAGTDGLVVVDAGTADAADQVVAALRRISSEPIRYIINTSADADHVGGNGTLSKAGRHIFAMGPEPIGGRGTRELTRDYAASILAPETVLTRMAQPGAGSPSFPTESLPTEAFTESMRDLYLNGEGIQVIRQPAAHSDGDSIVFFRRSDVIVAGDVIDATRFPVIDVARGGSIQGEINALNAIIRLAVRPVPFPFENGGTYVIPGHGRVYSKLEVVDYRDMMVIIRDTIADMKRRRMTVEQVKAASPVRPYERQYGATSGPWTTEDFVEAVYATLGEITQ